jgi:hypothetical protein
VPKVRVQRKHLVRKRHVPRPPDLRHAPKEEATVLKLPKPTPRRLGPPRRDVLKDMSTNSISGLLG